MQYVEFNLEMNKLRDVYGPKKYTEARMAFFWGFFCELPYRPFKAAVEKLIAHEERAPLIDKFMETLRPDLGKLKEEKIKALEAKGRCDACSNTGAVILCDSSAPTGTQPYAFKCSCEWGEIKARSHAPAANAPMQFVKHSTNRKLDGPATTNVEGFKPLLNFDFLKPGEQS
jgi:hypothetical protein